MKGKAQIKTALVVSVITTAILIVVERLWGNHITEQLGFGLLIGFSYAALRK